VSVPEAAVGFTPPVVTGVFALIPVPMPEQTKPLPAVPS
jgi:hypothetical protein